jgi:hypothetical protein
VVEGGVNFSTLGTGYSVTLPGSETLPALANEIYISSLLLLEGDLGLFTLGPKDDGVSVKDSPVYWLGINPERQEMTQVRTELYPGKTITFECLPRAWMYQETDPCGMSLELSMFESGHGGIQIASKKGGHEFQLNGSPETPEWKMFLSYNVLPDELRLFLKTVFSHRNGSEWEQLQKTTCEVRPIETSWLANANSIFKTLSEYAELVRSARGGLDTLLALDGLEGKSFNIAS